jgi:hypothetical protein
VCQWWSPSCTIGAAGIAGSGGPHGCARSAAHLAGTALDNHEAVLADGTSLLGVGQRRAGIGGLERLVVVLRHGGRKRARTWVMQEAATTA